MNKVSLRLFTISTFLGGVALFAADAWVAKPYTEWNDKDLQKIMFDSPFSRKVSVTLGGFAGGAQLPQGSGAAGGGGRGGRGGGGPQGGNFDPGVEGGGGGGVAESAGGGGRGGG